MKKHFLAITLSACLLLAGCSGNTQPQTPSGAANQTTSSVQNEPVGQPENPKTAESASEEITIGWLTAEAPDESGEPVIADNQTTFYKYGGRRWWSNLDEPGAEFILSGGKYTPHLDAENDPAAGAGIEQGFAIYPTVESLNEGGWKYVGNIKQDNSGVQTDFYLAPDGETMLKFTEVTDEGADLSDGDKLFVAFILVPSVV